MKIKTLQLQNIQSYKDETITFDDGETLIYGENGAGKTTILRAIFGALFQNRSAHQIHSGYTLDKLVRKGESQGKIELEFEVEKSLYKIEWVLEVETVDGEREFKGTKKCVLTSDELKSPVEGVKSVRATVEELIGMTAQSFVNSVYVQQGDITRLLYATAKERKEIFDGLLGLTQIDSRIERLDEARLGVNDTISATETTQNDIENRLEDLPSLDEVQEQLRVLRTKKEKEHKSLEEVSDNISQLENKKEEIEKQIEIFQETKEKLVDVKENLKEAHSERESYDKEIQELQEESKKLGEKAEENRKKVLEIQEKLDIQENEIEPVKEKKEELENSIEKKKDEQSNLKIDIQSKKNEKSHLQEVISSKEEELKKLSEKIDALQTEIEEIESSKKELSEKKNRLDEEFKEESQELNEKLTEVGVTFDNEKIEYSLNELINEELAGKVTQLSSKIEQAKERKGEETARKNFVRELNETGVCPICQTEHTDEIDVTKAVEDSPIEKEINTLEESREAIKRLIEEARSLRSKLDTINKIESELSELEAEKDELEKDVEQLQAEKSDSRKTLKKKEEELSNQQEELKKLKRKKTELDDDLEVLQNKQETYELLYNKMGGFQELSSKQDVIQEKLESKKELKQKTIATITELQDKRNNLEEKLEDEDSESLEAKRTDVEEELKELYKQEETLEDALESIREDIADKKAKRDQIESERDRLQKTKERYEWLQERKAEIKQLKERYRQVKKELREENIALLNKFTNDIFTELHNGRSIQAINIDSDYTITLVKQDNSEISPDMSSGGESNTVNLAIRAGIYRLISEREGKGMLPPFILDEPTQFLDDAHITELRSFITAIKNWDIPQLLVVSHEPSLIDNANSILHVEIDRTNGESSVTKEYGTVNLGDKNA